MNPTDDPTLATKADTHNMRAEMYQAINKQTWRIVTWTTYVIAGLTVLFVAMNT